MYDLIRIRVKVKSWKLRMTTVKALSGAKNALSGAVEALSGAGGFSGATKTLSEAVEALSGDIEASLEP